MERPPVMLPEGIRNRIKTLLPARLTGLVTKPAFVAALFGVVAFFILVLMIAAGASADFIVLMGVMMTLAGLILYDVLSRRAWERDVATRLRTLTDYHDRLVREVARNRNDVAILKEGLAGAAASVEAQGRRLAPSGSAEARMIEAIVEQLGALGERPRAGAGARPEGREVMELEMAPPPLRRPPSDDLSDELDFDIDELNDSDVVDLIRQAVQSDSIDVYMQPVVSLPQRKSRMYEVFGRIRADSGVSLPAARYIKLAQREHLIPAIDNLLLLRCLQILRDRTGDDSGAPFILNITAATLNDRGFMGDLIAFLSQNRRTAGRLVFEMSQEEMDALAGESLLILDGLSKLGCRFSMDRVRRRQIDISALRQRHIRFIKIDAAWILNEGSTQNGFSRIVRLKKQLDAAGIDLIVEKIENENTLRELLDYNIDFGQGWLFGKPDRELAYLHTVKTL